MTEGADHARIDAMHDRLNSHDARLSMHDAKVQTLSEQMAVVALKQGAMSEDIKNLVAELQLANDTMNRRLGRLIAGVWAVFLVFVPIAYEIIRNSGGLS